MSTKFTIKSSASPLDQPLGQSLIQAHQWLSGSLLNLMHQRGHTDLTSAHLTFFNSLNCGMTHASEVARRMGISRQAVYKTTKGLQKLGALQLIEDPEDGRQKVISMTQRGERIALDARACLDVVEEQLAKKIGQKKLELLRSALMADWGPELQDEETGD